VIFGVTMALGLAYILLATLIAGKDIVRSMRIRRSWIKFISPILGLRIVCNSSAPKEGAYLYVSNHRSFMDPVVILHYIFAFPLAKAEVSKYPLLGYGARITGALYVMRESADSRLDARQAIGESLQEDMSVLIFPEGTTFNTTTSGPFKKGSFEIAAVLNVPVVPIAVEYEDIHDHWKEKSLFAQYMYQFSKRSTTCRIEFGDPIHSEDAMELMEDTQQWIDRQLLQSRADFDHVK